MRCGQSDRVIIARLEFLPLQIPHEVLVKDEEDNADRFVRLDEVKRRVGLGKSMIYQLVKDGKFPAPYKLSPAAARWSNREITAWIDDVKDGFEGKKRKV